MTSPILWTNESEAYAYPQHFVLQTSPKSVNPYNTNAYPGPFITYNSPVTESYMTPDSPRTSEMIRLDKKEGKHQSDDLKKSKQGTLVRTDAYILVVDIIYGLLCVLLVLIGLATGGIFSYYYIANIVLVVRTEGKLALRVPFMIIEVAATACNLLASILGILCGFVGLFQVFFLRRRSYINWIVSIVQAVGLVITVFFYVCFCVLLGVDYIIYEWELIAGILFLAIGTPVILICAIINAATSIPRAMLVRRKYKHQFVEIDQ
jgi:hypothetical protein